jgi:hypothetical protein
MSSDPRSSAAVHPSDPPLYATREGIAMLLGGDECVFRLRSGGESHVMTTDVLQALGMMRSFRTLSEHAQAVAAQLPALQGRSDVVLRVMENLVHRGLMIADSEIRDALTATSSAPPAPAGAASIRACDRPAQLAQLLDSLLANQAAHGVSNTFRVIDDSRDSASVDANRRLAVEAVNRGLAVRHLAPADQDALVARFEQALPAHRDAIRYLLGRERDDRRFGGGRALNLAALLAAGTRTAWLDEDFVLPLHRHPHAQPGLHPAGDGEPAVLVYSSRDEALAAGAPVAADPFELARRWCGHGLAAISALDSSFAVTRASLHGLDIGALRRVTAAGRVAAVQFGHRGQSGAAGSTFLFLLDDAGRRSLWSSREHYLRALDERNVFVGATRAALPPHASYTPFMVDGGALLPPTMPHGRCEDMLFNQLLPAIRADAVVLDAPYAIGHVPEAGRKPQGTLKDPDQPDLNTFLADYAVARIETLRSADPAQRLAAIAAHYADLAAAPAADREALLGEYLAHRRADLIQRLQQVFQQAGSEAPVYWQADVRLKIEVNGRALTAGGAPRLHGWPEGWDGRRCADALARELDAWSAAMLAWPALWAHALEANAAGGLAA